MNRSILSLAVLFLLGCGARSTPPVEPESLSLARAQDEIAAREYRASASRRRLQARNRRHNLRTYFDPTGIRVVDRTARGVPARHRCWLCPLLGSPPPVVPCGG